MVVMVVNDRFDGRVNNGGDGRLSSPASRIRVKDDEEDRREVFCPCQSEACVPNES